MIQFSNKDGGKREYNLEERLVKFAEDVIDFVKTLKIDTVNKRIIEQLTGAAGSAGANYCEAVEAESKKDFIHKAGICRKELKESMQWLRLLARAHPERKEEIRKLWKEAHELVLIFAKINRSSRQKNN